MPSEHYLTVAAAIELLIDSAYHDGVPMELAVAAEAYTLAGFHDGAIMVSHGGGHDEVLERVAQARRGRVKRLLTARAKGVIQTLEVLAENGLIDRQSCSEARRLRWLARGGHDHPASAL